LAGALLFDEKISQSAALFWFGLRDVGILHSRAVIHRTIDTFLAFLEHGLAEKFEHMQIVIRTGRRFDLFLREGIQNFELLSNIKEKNSKTYRG
jgi:hypothetical protein